MARTQMEREIEATIAKVRSSVTDFNKRDRKSLLTAAAAPVRKAARKRVPRSQRPHYRTANGRRIKYNPGNLQRSIKTLSFRRSPDAFVGPKFGGGRHAEYGGPGQPTDGYYYAMAFGGARYFRSLVLDPAVAESRGEVISRVDAKAVKLIQKRAKARGLDTR